jgi:hypothetical protein
MIHHHLTDSASDEVILVGGNECSLTPDCEGGEDDKTGRLTRR